MSANAETHPRFTPEQAPARRRIGDFRELPDQHMLIGLTEDEIDEWNGMLIHWLCAADRPFAPRWTDYQARARDCLEAVAYFDEKGSLLHAEAARLSAAGNFYQAGDYEQAYEAFTKVQFMMLDSLEGSSAQPAREMLEEAIAGMYLTATRTCEYRRQGTIRELLEHSTGQHLRHTPWGVALTPISPAKLAA